MRRERVAVRPDWRARLEAVGFTFHSMGGVYWDEGVCYAFSAAEIDQMEQITAELQALCLEAAEHVVRHKCFEELAIPPAWRERVVDSWRSGEPALYGRFDLCYDGHHPPKLLEYNADTPTALLEAGVAQWFWLQDLHPEKDQFNSIHEKLIARWQALRAERALPLYLHFACVHDTEEDYRTVEYLRDTALQTGFTTFQLFMEDVGWDARNGAFVDLEGRPIRGLFKLYPWEWLVREPFREYLRDAAIRLVEPCWKLFLSNKGLLPILWELFPNHPNLLPAAAAISLAGALLGFAVALASVIVHSLNLLDLVIWGAVALVVQVLAYLSVYALIRDVTERIGTGSVSHGIFLGVLSLCCGILNGACMTP